MKVQDKEVTQEQKEILESMVLKTIEKMIDTQNLSLLAVINESHQKNLFFPEFYEIVFVKMMTQFPPENALKITLNYENFGLHPLRASELFNEAIKYTDIYLILASQTLEGFLNTIHDKHLYLESYNTEKVKKSTPPSQLYVLDKNDKMKNYIKLNGHLTIKGLKTGIGKI